MDLCYFVHSISHRLCGHRVGTYWTTWDTFELLDIILVGVPSSTMSTSVASKSAEEVLYRQLKYRAVDPLEHNLHCLDVLIRGEQNLVRRMMSKFSSSMRPLVRMGSMLDVILMADKSKWRSAHQADLDRMRKGLTDLENPLKPRPSHQNFEKKRLVSANLSFSTSNKVVLWLASVAGIDLGNEESLSCAMDGLTAASVDYTKVCSWVMGGDWFPNIPFLQKICSDWSENTRSKVKKLWIVTEVLYATKFTVTGRRGLFGRVMAHATIGTPGVGVDAGGDIGVKCINETTLELKAKRNKQFIVGYRTMRVEFNPDGKPVLMRKAEDGGLRGDDDDYLAAMGEDIFEVDEYESKVLIPLITPTEQELNNPQAQVVALNSDDPEATGAST